MKNANVKIMKHKIQNIRRAIRKEDLKLTLLNVAIIFFEHTFPIHFGIFRKLYYHKK